MPRKQNIFEENPVIQAGEYARNVFKDVTAAREKRYRDEAVSSFMNTMGQLRAPDPTLRALKQHEANKANAMLLNSKDYDPRTAGAAMYNAAVKQQFYDAQLEQDLADRQVAAQRFFAGASYVAGQMTQDEQDALAVAFPGIAGGLHSGTKKGINPAAYLKGITGTGSDGGDGESAGPGSYTGYKVKNSFGGESVVPMNKSTGEFGKAYSTQAPEWEQKAGQWDAVNKEAQARIKMAELLQAKYEAVPGQKNTTALRIPTAGKTPEEIAWLQNQIIKTFKGDVRGFMTDATGDLIGIVEDSAGRVGTGRSIMGRQQQAGQEFSDIARAVQAAYNGVGMDGDTFNMKKFMEQYSGSVSKEAIPPHVLKYLQNFSGKTAKQIVEEGLSKKVHDQALKDYRGQYGNFGGWQLYEDREAQGATATAQRANSAYVGNGFPPIPGMNEADYKAISDYINSKKKK